MYKTEGDGDFILQSTAGKVLIFSTVLILPKAARDTQGVQVMRLTKAELESARPFEEGIIKNPENYVTKTVPVAGTQVSFDIGQLKFE